MTGNVLQRHEKLMSICKTAILFPSPLTFLQGPMIYVLQIDLSFSCVCPVIIDHEFRHNIAKVAADP